MGRKSRNVTQIRVETLHNKIIQVEINSKNTAKSIFFQRVDVTE